MAANLVRLRQERGLSTTRLASRLEELGNPIPATGITRIEKGQRRVDADDLVALADAFNVSPTTLLLPPTYGDDLVQLTREHEVTSRTAWRWAEGHQTAMDWDAHPTANSVDGDPAIPTEAYEREQEFAAQQTAYRALARPPAHRRVTEHQAVYLASQLMELLGDLVASTPSADQADLAVLAQTARHRYDQLGIELKMLRERLTRTDIGSSAPKDRPGGN
ncbi:helix-turn-helix domain-containing protein [Streptomyces hokutonensis]|uniref:helix-turn-helix domain-containing protein n=1 Tax=Streptomyces hokutonensis TaxID=1306990 RepID=UPI000372C718|nr:helix-turn-helix transcriptional regulator [Streptomyces hokutonensis]